LFLKVSGGLNTSTDHALNNNSTRIQKKELIDGKTAEFAWYPTQYNEAAERERESTFTWLSYI